MAKKKKKVLNKKQSQKKGDKINNDLIFKAWDLFARETPSVKRGILERKLSAHSSDNKERLLSVYDHVPRSRLRKTIAALRNTINKNNILIDDRFAMMMGASKYSADLVVFDFHNKQRLELNFKMYFFVDIFLSLIQHHQNQHHFVMLYLNLNVQPYLYAKFLLHHQ